MKKKIINGILMVALLFAATTSFVSCKDNVDDELVAVYAQLAKQKADLQAQIDSYQTQIDALKQKDQLQDAAIDNLQDEIDDLQDQLDAINSQIAEQSAAIDEIKNRLDEVETDIDQLGETIHNLEVRVGEIEKAIEELNKQITGIKINQTINNVTGTINLPGGMLNLNALAAFNGENVMGLTEFPTSKFADNHIYEDNQLTADEVAPAAGQQYTFNTDGYITEKHNNAGMLFFTVQALDQDNFDISEYTLTAQNSQGKKTPITFSDVKPSSYLIQPGVYKSAYVDSDPDLNGDPTFFQARAHIAESDLEASKFNVNKFINLKEFVNSDFKNMVNDIKAAKGTKAKVKAVVKVASKFLANIYSGNMSGDNKDIKNPSWSDHKLVLSKEVDGVVVSKTALDYDLAVSAVQPLSYNSFWAYENGVKKMDLDLVESAVARLAKKVKAALPTIGSTTFPKLKEISADGLSAYVWAIDDNTGAMTAGAWVELPAQIIDAINNGLQIEDLNTALQKVSKTADLGTTVDKLEARFNNYIEAFGNKVVSALNNHMLTRAITPFVLYNGANGINRLVTGMTFRPGTMQINVTSPTEELICPAYAKYVAVFKDGKATEAYVTPGSTQRFNLNLTQPGNYKIVVSCCDYFGYIVNKRFEVTVE
jgi:archaellum component FlaC